VATEGWVECEDQIHFSSEPWWILQTTSQGSAVLGRPPQRNRRW